MAGDVSIVLPQHNRKVIEHSINVNSFSYGERGKTKHWYDVKLSVMIFCENKNVTYLYGANFEYTTIAHMLVIDHYLLADYAGCTTLGCK